MPVTGQYLDSFNALFLAKITAKLFVGGSGSSGSGSGTGQWQYAWTEQDVNPSTGAAINCASPRQGTTSLNYALEINNNEITVPTYRWLRLRSVVLGQPVYEFFSDGSGVSGTSLNYRIDCTGGSKERWVQMITYVNGVVSSVSPWLFDSMQGCCSCVGYMPGVAGAQGSSTAVAVAPSTVVVTCTGTPVPLTLHLTVSGFTGPCSCMNGFTVTLNYDPAFGGYWHSSPFDVSSPCGGTMRWMWQCATDNQWNITGWNPDIPRSISTSLGITVTGSGPTFHAVCSIGWLQIGATCIDTGGIATITA